MERFDVSRRAFVAGATVIAAAGATTRAAPAADVPAAAPSPAASSAPDVGGVVPFTFDVAAFSAVLNRPYPHRQLVSAKSFADASDALAFMQNSLNAYSDQIGFNAGPQSFHAAAVLYHGPSVLLALDDPLWAKYPIGALLAKWNAQSGTAKPVDAKVAEKPVTANPHGAAYRDLVAKHGASFFVCNNALSGVAAYAAKQFAPAGTAVTRDQVVALHAEMVAHFLPGTLLVPAGVAAINAAQEAKFTLLVA
jgi:hypothetical protein